jgi:mycothiol system anti-sigma-R factor
MPPTPDDPYVAWVESLSTNKCQEALSTLYHYLDGELTPEKRDEIRHHLEECEPCLSAFDFEKELKALVGRCCREQNVPDSLRSRVVAALEGLSAEGAPPAGLSAEGAPPA